MCLQTYLQKHTRHISRFIDCRLMRDLEMELVRSLEELAPPRIMVVNCPILALGQVAAVLEIAKRHFPTMRTVLCGAYPSAFPEHVADIPRADFALAGDPEPILRNLLDYVDVEPRLRRTPGLIMYGSVKIKPYWLPRLNALPLPHWEGIYWRDYQQGHACRAIARVTRGHAGTAGQRNHGECAQPARVWPLDRMAQFVSRCSNTEIGEVMLDDPPGHWDDQTLSAWTQALLHVRNAQPWGLTIHPLPLSEQLMDNLVETRCKRIDVLFPSLDRQVLSQYDLKLDGRGLEATWAYLRAQGIYVFPRFWLGSPEEPRGESDRIAQFIRRFALCDYRIEPFPFIIDSPLYAEHIENGEAAHLQEWIKWSRDPWLEERPVPLWGGRQRVAELDEQLQSIRKTLQRSPGLTWARWRNALKSRNWIELLEDRAIDWLQRRRTAS